MHRTLAAQLPTTAPGTRVRVEGWIHRRRSLSSVSFLVLGDHSGLAQVVVKDSGTVVLLSRLGEETVLSAGTMVAANLAGPWWGRARGTCRHAALGASRDAAG